jgi:cytosine/adenosine deaminase-related metal-dependent hydrolase
VVVIDGRGPGTSPIIDPYATVVLAADTANVDTVIVGGQVHKRGGRLTGDWDGARARLEASSAYLQETLAKKQAETAESNA